ncbi:34-kDa subunit of RNA polymerase III (C) [Allomyces javanicus]|nr:34-kDa subunit of RNA polymerase III (C) [Allomyces javanicus]
MATAPSGKKKLSTLEKRMLDILASYPEDAEVSNTDLQAKMNVETAHYKKVVNVLAKKNYLEITRSSPMPYYRLIKEEEKEKVDELEYEEKLVFNYIKAVGTEGIWVRTLAIKTSLHQNSLSKALKKLEQRGLIKQVKSVKYGSKKFYMLAELQPSNEVTGGIWFTDQELDLNFVNTVAHACLRAIARKSFPQDSQAVFPSNYNRYLTITKITREINKIKITNVELTQADVEAVLDMLIFDNKIEKLPVPAEPLLMAEDDDDANNPMGGMNVSLDEDHDDGSADVWMYRALKENWTETEWAKFPCGVCPVRRDCTPDGAVNPRDCKYINDWLKF